MGLTGQIKADRKGQFLIAGINTNGNNHVNQMAMETESTKKRYKIVAEDDDKFEMAWGDVTGAEIDPTIAKQARVEESECVRDMSLYTNVLIKECYDKTGRAPFTVRWIDINKGDQANPNYRSRFVARETNTHTNATICAPELHNLKHLRALYP